MVAAKTFLQKFSTDFGALIRGLCRDPDLTRLEMNRYFEISDRPILAMISISEFVYACCGASHSVYVFDQEKVIQDLYTKEFGHSDWVTCLLSLRDCIYSAGIDGVLCKWTRVGSRFTPSKAVLIQGPISKLICDNDIWAASYDGTICCYSPNLELKRKIIGEIPIVDFDIQDGLVYSANKKGQLYQYSLNDFDIIQAHHGPFAVYARRKTWTVGQDGFIRCFDFSVPKEKGRRLVNIQLSPVYCSTANEKHLFIVHHQGNSILDINTKKVKTVLADQVGELSRTAYCCVLHGSKGYIGWGNGDMSIINCDTLVSKRLSTGLKNAIRCITITNTILVTGDDGTITFLPL
jgi:hypothetical protein